MSSDAAPAPLLLAASSADVTYDRLLRADREPHNWLSYSGNYSGPSLQPAVADQPEQRQEPAAEVVLPSALREEHQRAEQDGEHAAGGGRRHVHRHRARDRGARRGHRAAVLEALAPARSEGVLQRLRSQQRNGDRRQHVVLGDRRLSPDRDRREERARSSGTRTLADYRKGYQYNVPPLVVRDKVDPWTGDQRSGRQLLGLGVRRQDRQGALALRHRADVRRCARKRRPGWAIRGSTAAVRSGTPAATIRKRT